MVNRLIMYMSTEKRPRGLIMYMKVADMLMGLIMCMNMGHTTCMDDEESRWTGYLCRWISGRHGLTMLLGSANWFRAVTLPSNAAWRQTNSAEQWSGLLAQVATNEQQLNERLYLNRDYKSEPPDRPLWSGTAPARSTNRGMLRLLMAATTFLPTPKGL